MLIDIKNGKIVSVFIKQKMLQVAILRNWTFVLIILIIYLCLYTYLHISYYIK